LKVTGMKVTGMKVTGIDAVGSWPRVATPSATEEAFIDLVCADDELLHAAFDAIVAQEWPVPPSVPPAPRRAGLPAPGSGSRRRRLPPDGRRPVPPDLPVSALRRQRSPPPAARRSTT
jgi:hypothetical protein